jgi:hypothetical protein
MLFAELARLTARTLAQTGQLGQAAKELTDQLEGAWSVGCAVCRAGCDPRVRGCEA